MMRPYTDIQNDLAQRQSTGYTPPAIPTVKQTPVEIPGVMYQTRELFHPVVAIPPEGSK